jgi:hypothetical protein
MMSASIGWPLIRARQSLAYLTLKALTPFRDESLLFSGDRAER